MRCCDAPSASGCLTLFGMDLRPILSCLLVSKGRKTSIQGAIWKV